MPQTDPPTGDAARARPRSSGRPRVCLAAALGVLAAGGAARAADTSEFWPELSAFVRLNEDTRLYLDASYARDRAEDRRSLDLSAFVDVSLEPILREELRSKDWRRARYLWTRIGYTRVAKATDGERGTPEDRASFALYAKAELPAEIWIEARARADLRWIGDQHSTRTRLRLEANREFTLQEHAVVPYFNFEWFGDSRYDGLARTLAQAGAEVTLSPRFRFEVYFAHQTDRQPSTSQMNALGVVGKWYF